ncbi:MAG: hypothetical protein ABIQ39_10885 [Ilumatobacteraceae bacterium]
MSCSRSTSGGLHQQSMGPPKPIRNPVDALQLIHLAMASPLRHETLGFLLDDAGFGNTIVVVADTQDPDAVLAVADCLSAAGGDVPSVASLVLATVRPAGDRLDDDVDRWMEASDITECNGLQLIEWFVVGPIRMWCPRAELGEPSRWDGR